MVCYFCCHSTGFLGLEIGQRLLRLQSFKKVRFVPGCVSCVNWIWSVCYENLTLPRIYIVCLIGVLQCLHLQNDSLRGAMVCSTSMGCSCFVYIDPSYSCSINSCSKWVVSVHGVFTIPTPSLNRNLSLFQLFLRERCACAPSSGQKCNILTCPWNVPYARIFT